MNKGKKIAKGIVNMALYTVENSVGKCCPLGVHEVKMPESVRKEFLHKNNESKN